jgi:clan AA aspartic protease (TIGR02281 family)
MGSITKTLLVLSIFVLGVAIGWLARDYDGHNETEFKADAQVAQLEPATSIHLYQLQKLFDTNRFEAAVTGMQELSEADFQTMRAYLHHTAANLIVQGMCEQQLRLFGYYFQQFERSATGLVLQARCQAMQLDYEAAISNLYEARTFEISYADEELIGQLLMATVLNQDQLYRAEGRLGELDYFYQTLLVQEPDQGAFYMQLALIRQESGDVDGSIGALLQIQNDQALGSKARELLDQMQSEKDQIRNSAEIIPLQISGSRLIVNAVMDGRYPIRLLLDTGAAITVVEPDVLQNAGYRLDQARIVHFKTANGNTQAPMVKIENLAIRTHIETDLSVGSLPLDLGTDVDGLLGMNYLKHYRFSVDQVEGLLYLSRRM